MRWLTNNIATAAFSEIHQDELQEGVMVFDVRDLVDKSGNDYTYIRKKIEDALALANSGKKLVICCDYGMSRSNSIAIGVISRLNKISFSEAVDIVKNKVDSNGIKVEMLNTVYQALKGANASGSTSGNILLTGASGFLGSALKKDIKSNTVYSPTSAEINLSEQPIELDLYVKDNGITTIVHLANPKIFTTNKSLGGSLVMLKNVLDVCRSNNIKICYLSGWEIYSGYKSAGLFADEKLEACPKGTYGETKWFCELLIKQYVNTYNVTAQIIRSGPVYGMGSDKPKFLYNFIQKARKNEDIHTHRFLNGSPMLDLLYINDFVTIVSKVVESDFVGDLNIGSSVALTTKEVAQKVIELTNSSSKIHHVPINEFAPNIIMDNSQARKLFGWSPQITFENGLKEILKNYNYGN